jgi:calcium-dependent protein kinase
LQITGELRDVNEYYDIEQKELGHGHYGTVRTGINKASGKKLAIKTIPKAKVSRPETMRREISILRTLDHPNIIKLYDVFEGNRHLHLVTELCTGGELFDRIIARGHYSEADAAVLVRKICDAVKHCHDRDICHRDLKPENFLFETPAEDAELKVIDFGLSRMDDGLSAGVMTTRVGTPYYIAPEVLGRHYDKSCDLWSIGVITYILLCGYPPFYGDTDPEIFASVRAGRYDFDSPEWTNVSAEAKDLISRLLLLDPSKRLTADEALRHPWLSGFAPSTEINLNSNIFSSLKRFTGHNKLKKAALAVIADQMTETEIDELKKQFMAIDSDGNGVITIAELADALRGMGLGMIEEEVTELLKGIDIDGDGLIDYPEFLAATMKRNLANKEEYLVNAFNYFDTKKQGVITKADLVQFMGSEEQAQEVIDEVDVNGDGLISFEEFVGMMERKGFGDESEIGGSSDDLSGSFLSAKFPPGGAAAPGYPPIKETEL